MSLLSLCFENNFESDRAAFLYQRYQRRENKEIVLTRIGLARKGDPHKGCDTQKQLNPVAVVEPGDCVVIILCLQDFSALRLALHLILHHICPGYLQVCPLFLLFRHC